MCLYSKPIRNKKYEKNEKNGGIIPTVHDTRVLWVQRKCGRCIECMNEKRRNWQLRLLEDIKLNKNAKFVTLTLSNESILDLSTEINFVLKEPLEGYRLDNAIATLALRRFNERWRKLPGGKALRHWMVTELGHQNTENIHLHGFVWTDHSYDTIRAKWKYGFIWPRNRNEERTAFVSARTVNYCTKYVSKIDKDHREYRQLTLSSPGIGKCYIREGNLNAYNNRFQFEKTEQTYITSTGHKMKLPKYWRDKLYTDEQKEILWRIEMDKNIKWVNGSAIPTHNGEHLYFKALKHARRLNKEMGYGDYNGDWKRQTYEHEKRKLLIAKRIDDANKKRGYELWKPIDNDWWEF